MDDSAFYGFHVNPSYDKSPIIIQPAIDGGVLEASMSETKPEIAGQRDRSPSFPFIPLKVAVDRLVKFEEHHKRAPVPPDRIGAAWGMKPNSSQAQQTLAALKAFGLLETRRATDGRYVYISEDGRTYLRAQQDSIKSDVLRRAGLRPKQIAIHWKDWGDERPNDAHCQDDLVLKGGFSEDGAEKFLRVYDETIAYAGLSDSDKIVSDPEEDPPAEPGEGEDKEDDPSPSPATRSTVPPARSGVRLMEGERVVFTEESDPTRYIKLIASGDIDETLLDALTDYVKRQRKRLNLPAIRADAETKQGEN
jgi:hypothetical protein